MIKSISEMIQRNTPKIADFFETEITDKKDGCDCYGYKGKDGKILLYGSDKVCIALAYKKYLTKYCSFTFDLCGDNNKEINTAPSPEAFEDIIIQKYRVFGDCYFYSNDAWKWDFPRWEKEIDRLAMNGINLALNLVGNEAIYYYTLVRMDFNESDAFNFISAPPFYAWQQTNKLNGYLTHKNPRWLDDSLILGKKIFDRMTECGITPILSTFSGMVPKSVIPLFGGEKITVSDKWESFGKTYHFNIDNPNFRRFFLKYMEIQEEYIGKSDFYLCNQFCNKARPKKKKEIAVFEQYGTALDKIADYCNENAVLVFTSEGYEKYSVSKIKRCSSLILDVDGKRRDEEKGFNGLPFVLGNSQNNNSHNSMQGNIKKLSQNPYSEIKNKYPNLCGSGLFPESINQNPVYFELSFDILTENNKIDLKKWFESYEKRRYLSDNENSEKRLEMLLNTCYGDKVNLNVGSAICSRPALTLRHTAIGDEDRPQYENGILVEYYRSLSNLNSNTDGYYYDLCNTAKQIIDNLAFEYLENVTRSYRDRNPDEFNKNCDKFLEIIKDADAVLSSEKHFYAKTHLDDAVRTAADDKEKDYFSVADIAYLTVWGPMSEENRRYDCGWQMLGGMVKEYSFIRWSKFFEQLSSQFKFIGFQDRSRQQFSDRNAYAFSQFYKDMARFEQGLLLTFNPGEIKEYRTKEICDGYINKYFQN